MGDGCSGCFNIAIGILIIIGLISLGGVIFGAFGAIGLVIYLLLIMGG